MATGRKKRKPKRAVGRRPKSQPPPPSPPEAEAEAPEAVSRAQLNIEGDANRAEASPGDDASVEDPLFDWPDTEDEADPRLKEP